MGGGGCKGGVGCHQSTCECDRRTTPSPSCRQACERVSVVGGCGQHTVVIRHVRAPSIHVFAFRLQGSTRLRW